jgi:hypothetical protein
MPDFSAYTTAQLAKEIASYRFKPVKNRDQMITLLEKCWEGKNRIALGALGTNVLSQPPIESSKPAAPASSQISAAPQNGREEDHEKIVQQRLRKGKVGRPKKSTTVEFLEWIVIHHSHRSRTPKKSKKKGKEVAEDISDSDTEPSPPRPFLTSISNQNPPLPLKLSTDLEIDTIRTLPHILPSPSLHAHNPCR